MKEVTRIWATYGVDVAVVKPAGRGRDGAVTLTVKIPPASTNEWCQGPWA